MGVAVEETPAPAGPIVFNVTVPEGVTPGQILKFPGPDGRERQAKVPEGVEAGQTFSVQDGPPMVQFEVTVPEGSKEGEVMTFFLPDGRPKTTHVPAGLNAGDKFPVVIPAPVLFPLPCQRGRRLVMRSSILGRTASSEKSLFPKVSRKGKPSKLWCTHRHLWK